MHLSFNSNYAKHKNHLYCTLNLIPIWLMTFQGTIGIQIGDDEVKNEQMFMKNWYTMKRSKCITLWEFKKNWLHAQLKVVPEVMLL